MAPKSGFGVKFASILAVLLFLVLLGVAPRLLRQTRFAFDPGAPTASGGASIPMEDRSFPVIAGGKGLPRTVTLKDLAARSPNGLLINFWATWCPPCLDELPSLDFLNRQLNGVSRDKLPLLVTISVDESPQDVAGLFETLDFSPTLLVLHDPLGAYSQALGTVRFPETYLVDPSGKVLHKWIGPQNWLSQEVLTRLSRSR